MILYQTLGEKRTGREAKSVDNILPTCAYYSTSIGNVQKKFGVFLQGKRL